ncbi:MAG: protease inhibitor I42 family protein [Anaerolineales bacterium]|nr:protease inhibitor I42 family protein [Anaerolineales bacterium]
MIKKIFITLLLSLLLAGCVSGGAITLTAQDAGKSVEVKAGETFKVTLDGNPTTGYAWEVAADSSAPVTQVGEWEFKADSDAVGAGGKLTLTFQAGQGGQGALKLVYHRPFEAQTPPAETFEVQIVIK